MNKITLRLSSLLSWFSCGLVRRPSYSSFFLISLCLCFPSNLLSFNPCLSSSFLDFAFCLACSCICCFTCLSGSFSCSLDRFRCCLRNLSGRIFCCFYGLTCCLSCIGCYMAVSDLLSCITNFFRSIPCCDRSFLYRRKFWYSSTLMEFFYWFSCSRRCFTNGFCYVLDLVSDLFGAYFFFLAAAFAFSCWLHPVSYKQRHV